MHTASQHGGRRETHGSKGEQHLLRRALRTALRVCVVANTPASVTVATPVTDGAADNTYYPFACNCSIGSRRTGIRIISSRRIHTYPCRVPVPTYVAPSTFSRPHCCLTSFLATRGGAALPLLPRFYIAASLLHHYRPATFFLHLRYTYLYGYIRRGLHLRGVMVCR